MARKLFVNLPIANLKRSVDFFTQLGFSFNPHFTDERSTCMIIGEDAYAMLLEQSRFADFNHGKALCDTSSHLEALFAFSVDSREEVDRLTEVAFAQGGKAWGPANDHGFMYQRSFQDPDGHVWELFWMDPAAIPSG